MRFSAAAARRGASASRFSCRASTPAPESPQPFSFPRSHRLTRGAELQVVRREGKRIRTQHLEVRALASLLPHARVGFVVPKYKHGSVERNQLKRRLRELARVHLVPALVALDVVIRPFPEAYAASFDALAEQVRQAGERLRRTAGAPGVPGAR